MRIVADAVKHPVGPSASDPDAAELTAQRFAETSRFRDQRSGEEIDHGGGDSFRQSLSQRATSRRGQDEFVDGAAAHGARRRTASTPRTTSPRA
jgi:hypothetical protein